MSSAYSSHRTSYVWLRGFMCVVGFRLDELNNYIDRYNKSGRWLDFWKWLELEEGYDVHGFDYIWNEGNPLMSQVHLIKGVIDYGL